MPFALLHPRRRGIAIDRLPTSGCTIMGEDRVDRPPRGCCDPADDGKPAHGRHRLRRVRGDGIDNTGSRGSCRNRAEGNPPKVFADHAAQSKSDK
ncbi:hypothetical protein D4Q85_00965, partial [bacterium]